MTQQITKTTAKAFLKSDLVQDEIKKTLGSKTQQFTASVLALIGQDDLLATAEPKTLLNAALTAAALDLPINKNLGFAHIIGYKNNKKGGIVEAQFQMGHKGFKQLAQRTGQYKFINDSDVREGELIKRDRLSGSIEFGWIDDDEKRENLPVVGYVSYFELHNGFSSTLYMSMAELEAHARRYSQAYKSNYGPWIDNLDAMARKTVTKLNISKNGPMSTELQKAVLFDQAVINDDQPDYIDAAELEAAKATEDEKSAIIEANTTSATNNQQATLIEQDNRGDNDTRSGARKRRLA